MTTSPGRRTSSCPIKAAQFGEGIVKIISHWLTDLRLTRHVLLFQRSSKEISGAHLQWSQTRKFHSLSKKRHGAITCFRYKTWFDNFRSHSCRVSRPTGTRFGRNISSNIKAGLAKMLQTERSASGEQPCLNFFERIDSSWNMHITNLYQATLSHASWSFKNIPHPQNTWLYFASRNFSSSES